MKPTFLMVEGQSQYGVFHTWQEALCREFSRLGMDFRRISVAESSTREFEPCEVSFGFNLTRQWSREHRMNRHFAWLVDHPTFQSTFFMSSITGLPVVYERCALGLVDEQWTRFAQETYEFPSAAFLPHATSLERPVAPAEGERPYEVVLFGSMNDPEECRANLFKHVDSTMPDCRPLVEMLANSCRYHVTPRLDETVLETLRQLKFPAQVVKIFMSSVFPLLDLYHRFRNRLDLIRSLTRHPVHIFGNGPWKTLNLPANVTVHEPLPHAGVLEVMRQARVLLNHAPTLTAGGHERVFDALASGCRVVSTASSFLQRELGDGQGLACYRADAEESRLDELLQELRSEPDRADRIAASQAIVFQKHHMGMRALQLSVLVKKRWPEIFGGTDS